MYLFVFLSAVTDPNGPAMTWSMTAIGYLELQEYSTANSYFIQGFANAQEPFQVWTETPTGVSHLLFVTFYKKLISLKGNCEFYNRMWWIFTKCCLWVSFHAIT